MAKTNNSVLLDVQVANELNSDSEGIKEANYDFTKSNWHEIVSSFEDMHLNEYLIRAIMANGYSIPTPFQQRAIMPCIRGFDVIMQSESGSGKTTTFSIAVIQQIDTSINECQALIMSPTRELAISIQKLVLSLGDYLNIQCHACIGGTNIRQDVRILETGVQVISGTPGRVCDMLKKKAFRTDYIKIFILTDTDKFFERSSQSKSHSKASFKENIDQILRALIHLPDQVILSSTKKITEVIDVHELGMKNPIEIIMKNN